MKLTRKQRVKASMVEADEGNGINLVDLCGGNMTKWELLRALMSSTVEGSKLSLKNNYGIVAGVERESGDGRSFNVKMNFEDGTSRTVFVRTDD